MPGSGSLLGCLARFRSNAFIQFDRILHSVPFSRCLAGRLMDPDRYAAMSQARLVAAAAPPLSRRGSLPPGLAGP